MGRGPREGGSERGAGARAKRDPRPASWARCCCWCLVVLVVLGLVARLARARVCVRACSACQPERGEVAGSAPARRAARPLLAGPLDRRGGVDGSSPGAARGSRLADGEFA